MYIKFEPKRVADSVFAEVAPDGWWLDFNIRAFLVEPEFEFVLDVVDHVSSRSSWAMGLEIAGFHSIDKIGHIFWMSLASDIHTIFCGVFDHDGEK